MVRAADAIELTGTGLDSADVVAVARDDARVTLGEDARQAIGESAAIVERLAASDEPAYGTSTGFGSVATTPHPPPLEPLPMSQMTPGSRREELQRALIRSHAAGMGPRWSARWCGRCCCCAPAA